LVVFDELTNMHREPTLNI